MELKDEFSGSNATLLNCIKALLELDAAGVLVPHGVGGHARVMLAAAGARIAALEEKLAELEAENTGLALDKLTAPPAQDGLKIVRTEHSSDHQGFQHYNVSLSDGRAHHFFALRVVKTLNADGPDAREADHFAAIERRLLAGNPVEV
ncbi:hypothetical protein BcepIL02_gp32 [Burkholderia phage BcepIL02]|uniref:Uncharacterized protein n=1 Tax=Burkholderia phage BcepIL02 TaxID=2886898 RepID=C5IHM4_9CAUD|nr:hypothetical protein BcepIL02_gp32 [Burkholderia phage BcepIL02]ACR15025.1 hypothetical protein BcepIL02_gp32 [Burkholderia phage BcepIL02]